jgi:hypothetical protein
MHTVRRSSTSGQECHAKGSRKENKVQIFMHREKTNVKYEMYDYTCNKWSDQKSNKGLKKILETIPGEHSIDSL